MRPIKLTIEGLNSFTDEQVVDFEAAGADNIFCISGVTGSGKSTVLDAMILSLYKKHSTRGNLANYINLKRDSARIVFEFELGGKRYETTREIYRKKAGKFVVRTDGALAAEGDAAFEMMNEAIGLDVEEFTNVVVLQQGEFSRFLKATKRDRVQLISKLFDLGRFGELYTAFNKKATALRSESEAISRKEEAYGDVSDETVAALSAELAAKEKEKLAAEEEVKRTAALVLDATKAREAFVRDEENAKKAAEAEQKLAAYKAREKNGEEYSKKLDERERELKAREKRRDGLIAARTAAEEAKKRSAEAEEKLKKIAAEEKTAGEKAAEAAAAEERHKRFSSELEELDRTLSPLLRELGTDPDDAAAGLARVAAEIKRRDDEFAAAEENEKEAARILKEATAAHDLLLERYKKISAFHTEVAAAAENAAKEAEKAAAEYERAVEENALAVVTAGLKVGDTCPVCGGKIDELHRGRDCDLAALKACRDAAEKAAKETAERLTVSRETVSGLNEKINASGDGLLAAQKAHKEKAAALGGFDAEAAAKRRALCKRATELYSERTKKKEACDKAAKEAETSALIAKSEMRSVEVRKAAAEAEAEAAARALAGYDAEPVETELKALTEAREKFDADKKQADELLAAIVREVAAAEASIALYKSSLTGATKVTEEEVAAAAENAKLAEEKRNGLIRSTEALSTRLARDIADLGSKKQCIAERAKVDAEHAYYAELSTLFFGNAFTEFVAAEHIKEFTSAASVKLAELTGGKYRLLYDEATGEFSVRDFLAGNEVRPIGTLSGGETFLASLSLAIAISAEISKDRDYGFFFIDEGFGTLSPDALDTVTSALETLSRTTMVGVITHRGELIERIPSAIRVEPADEEHGSRVFFGS